MKNKKLIKEIKENFVFDNLYVTSYPDKIICTINGYSYVLEKFNQPIKKFHCEKLLDGLKGNDFIIKSDNKWGVINYNGKFIIPPIYDDISGFNNKEYLVLKNNKYKILSNNGDIVKELLYSHMECCYFSLYIVSLNGKKGIINANDKVVIPIKYDEILYKYDSDTLFVSKNNKWKWINLKNETIAPMKYYKFIEMSADTVAAKNENGKFVILNNKGKQICETEFEDIGYCFNEKIGLCPAKLNGKYGFIDKFGNIKIDFQYKNADDFGSKYAKVTDNNDNVFYIDENNNMKVVGNIYENYFFIKLSKNRFIVSDNPYTYGIVDDKNNIITDFIYDFIYPVPKSCNYKNILGASYKGKYGFIDYDGNVIKIDKEKFDNIPETVLDYSVCKNLPMEEALELVFDGKEVK